MNPEPNEDQAAQNRMESAINMVAAYALAILCAIAARIMFK
jgi:hypothetical protein